MQRYILSKPVEVKLDRPRLLHYSLGSIVDVEELLGCGITELPSWHQIQPKQLRLLLWAAMRDDDPDVTVEEAGETISLLVFPEVMAKLGESLVQAYGEPDTVTQISVKKKKGGGSSINWRSLWPLAVVTYGLTTEEFWKVTPKELIALHDRFLWHLENTDFNFATVAQVVANCNRGKNTKAFKAKDFMPQRRGKQKVQDYREQLEIARQITLAYGGKVRADLMEGIPTLHGN